MPCLESVFTEFSLKLPLALFFQIMSSALLTTTLPPGQNRKPKLLWQRVSYWPPSSMEGLMVTKQEGLLGGWKAIDQLKQEPQSWGPMMHKLEIAAAKCPIENRGISGGWALGRRRSHLGQ